MDKDKDKEHFQLDPKDVFFVVGLLAAAVGIVTVMYMSAQKTEDRHKWDSFIQANECREVERVEKITTYKIGVVASPDGAMHPSVGEVVYPRSVGYLCKDGVTYWRPE